MFVKFPGILDWESRDAKIRKSRKGIPSGPATDIATDYLLHTNFTESRLGLVWLKMVLIRKILAIRHIDLFYINLYSPKTC